MIYKNPKPNEVETELQSLQNYILDMQDPKTQASIRQLYIDHYFNCQEAGLTIREPGRQMGKLYDMGNCFLLSTGMDWLMPTPKYNQILQHPQVTLGGGNTISVKIETEIITDRGTKLKAWETILAKIPDEDIEILNMLGKVSETFHESFIERAVFCPSGGSL